MISLLHQLRPVLIVMCCLLNGMLPAQTVIDSTLAGLPVTAIDIFGNHVTREEVILREMKTGIGDSADPARLEEDRKRIQSLNIFNRVILLTEQSLNLADSSFLQDGIFPDSTGLPAFRAGVSIRIVVSEMWYVIPVPILFIHDRDWEKLSYGAGLVHLNFRGRAENLTFQFWVGYNPSFKLDYTNPGFGRGRNTFAMINLYSDRISSKHFTDADVTEKHLGLQGSLGRRFGYHTRLSLTLGYKAVACSPGGCGLTLSDAGEDRMGYAALSLIWDTRDLIAYPHHGWVVSLGIQKNGLPGDAGDYLKARSDIRKYIPLSKKMTLALRSSVLLSRGDLPLYSRVYLGYTERIRGHFTRVAEGENRALASAALRFPLIPIRYVNLHELPQLTNLKFGVSFGLFADTGLIWFRDQAVTSSMLLSGFGFGLHFHLPYVNVLRVETAFDEAWNHEFIFDLYVDI